MKKIEHQLNDAVWIDIEDPTEEELMQLNLPFDIDENLLEDALEVGHLPKIERVTDYTFMIMRAYTASEDEKAIDVDQISNKIAFFIHEKGLLTVHRAPFDFILEHRSEEYQSIDELVLNITDDILMTFEQPLRDQADRMDILEQQIFINRGSNISIEGLYYEKSRARLTKKILLISQKIISKFQVSDDASSKLQDLKDTIIDFILRSEEIIDDATALLNSYMSFAAQKSNDVMKLLTIFSAFFLPLTFIAGVYGMNFQNMPELQTQNGYFFTIGVMLVIGIIIFIWFKRKKII